MTLAEMYKLAAFVQERQRLIGRMFVPLNDEEKFAVAVICGIPPLIDGSMPSFGIGWTGNKFVACYCWPYYTKVA